MYYFLESAPDYLPARRYSSPAQVYELFLALAFPNRSKSFFSGMAESATAAPSGGVMIVAVPGRRIPVPVPFRAVPPRARP